MNPDEADCPKGKRKADGENQEPTGLTWPYLSLTEIHTRKHLANHARWTCYRFISPSYGKTP